MYSTTTLKTPNADDYLRRYCNDWSQHFPVLLFNDGAGTVDFGQGREVHLCSTEACLSVTVYSQHGESEIQNLEKNIAQQLSQLGSCEPLNLQWSREEVTVS